MLPIDEIYLLFGLLQVLFLNLRHDHVENTYGNTWTSRELITHGFNFIQNFRRASNPLDSYAAFNYFGQLLFTDQEITFRFQTVFRNFAIDIAQVLRQNFIEQQPPEWRLDQAGYLFSVHHFRHPHLDFSVQAQTMLVISHQSFVQIRVRTAFTRLARFQQGQIIAAKNHILGRHRNRFTVLRFQQVVSRQHQEPCFRLCLRRQR